MSTRAGFPSSPHLNNSLWPCHFSVPPAQLLLRWETQDPETPADRFRAVSLAGSPSRARRPPHHRGYKSRGGTLLCCTPQPLPAPPLPLPRALYKHRPPNTVCSAWCAGRPLADSSCLMGWGCWVWKVASCFPEESGKDTPLTLGLSSPLTAG